MSLLITTPRISNNLLRFLFSANNRKFTSPFYLLTISILLLGAVGANAQTTGDYRSVASGNWNIAATWERYNGTAWVAAIGSPTSSDGVITIRNGNTVTANTSLTIDQTVVAVGGTLAVTDRKSVV